VIVFKPPEKAAFFVWVEDRFLEDVIMEEDSRKK